VYVCEIISDTTLLTASDDTVTLWTISVPPIPAPVSSPPAPPARCPRRLQFEFENLGLGTLGGGRNPHDIIYVFDASYCPSLDVIAVGLSDGTTRVVSAATGECLAIVSIPLDKCYVTSVRFVSAREYVCTYNTGHIVVYSLSKTVKEGPDYGGVDFTLASGVVRVLGDDSTQSVVFGAAASPDGDFLVSYSADGTARLYRNAAGPEELAGKVAPPVSRMKAGVGEMYACDIKRDDEGGLVVVCGGNLEGENSFMGESVKVFKIATELLEGGDGGEGEGGR
jgi:WD40 repeat protein